SIFSGAFPLGPGSRRSAPGAAQPTTRIVITSTSVPPIRPTIPCQTCKFFDSLAKFRSTTLSERANDALRELRSDTGDSVRRLDRGHSRKLCESQRALSGGAARQFYHRTTAAFSSTVVDGLGQNTLAPTIPLAASCYTRLRFARPSAPRTSSLIVGSRMPWWT